MTTTRSSTPRPRQHCSGHRCHQRHRVAPLSVPRPAAIGCRRRPRYRHRRGTAQFGDFIPTPPARPKPGGSTHL